MQLRSDWNRLPEPTSQPGAFAAIYASNPVFRIEGGVAR